MNLSTEPKGNINIHAEGADAYILCLSTSDEIGSVIHDPEYDSVWSIKPGNVFDFATALGRIIFPMICSGIYFSDKTVGPFNTPGFYPPKPNKNMEVSISTEIWNVIYRNRNIILNSDITKNNICEIYDCLDRSASIKPENFSHEREIRIIYRPHIYDVNSNKHYLLPKLLNPILVPFDSLIEMVEVE